MYEVYGIKVGTFSMIMHIVCVLVQLAVQRKTFNIWKFLQIPYVIIFGSFLNFFYYDVLTFELNSYVMKFLLLFWRSRAGAFSWTTVAAESCEYAK